MKTILQTNFNPIKTENMKTSLPKRTSSLNLPAKKAMATFVAVFVALLGMAQTYTTKADGNWSSAATWVGGVVPSATLGTAVVINIKHDVTFDPKSDLVISGTLNITSDTLRFASAFNNKVTINSTGVLNVTNGGFIQDVTASKADMQMNGGRLIVSNSKMAISKGLNATQGAKRTYTNSTIQVCEKYEFDGTTTAPAIDTIKNSIVQVSMNASGDFHAKANATVRVSNAKVSVGNGSFIVDASAAVSVLTGATNNFGFNLIQTFKDLQNDGTWDARIDAYCVGKNVSGKNATDIDFTRPEDCSTTTTSAPAPELSFVNPVLKSGKDKAEGAIYRYSNVMTGVDAEVKLKKFSQKNITISSIDNNTTGWNKAFQPEFGLNGTVAPNQNWYIDFTMTFFKAGTNTKVKLPRADFTALDLDGDGQSVAEYTAFSSPANISYSTFSKLTTQTGTLLGSLVTCPVCNVASTVIQCLVCHGTGEVAGIDCAICGGDGVLLSGCSHPYDGIVGNVLQGPIQNYSNIDTSGTAVMATFQYTNIDHVDFRYGATTSAFKGANGSAVRMNSLWSKSFNMSPGLFTLPVTITNFSAVLNSSNNVNVSWQVANEKALQYLLQRSVDGKTFATIATIFPAEETNSYSYTDKGVQSITGTLYYRLVTVDQTKETQYSEIRVVRLGEASQESFTLATYPNPAKDNFRLKLPAAWQGKSVTLSLYSANGTLAKSLQFSSANQVESVEVTSLLKGMYLLTAKCGSETAQQRIIVN